MRIAAIGSCLSKRTALRIPGNEIITSVYHNRSDVLLDHLKQDGHALPSFLSLCRDMSAEADTPEAKVLLNQSLEGLGKHELPNGQPFFQAINDTKVDIIILDNFIDLVGRLFTLENELGYYYRYPNGVIPSGMHLGGRLTPAEAAENYRKIIEILRDKQPEAEIVLIQFPVNNYQSSDRRQWGFDFRDSLNLPSYVHNIPVKRVAPKFVGIEPQHFAHREYKKYAHQIALLLKLPGAGSSDQVADLSIPSVFNSIQNQLEDIRAQREDFAVRIEAAEANARQMTEAILTWQRTLDSQGESIRAMKEILERMSPAVQLLERVGDSTIA